MHLLAAGTPIAPDVPLPGNPLLGAPPPDLGRRNPLVLAVLPLADGIGDLHVGVALVAPVGGGLEFRGRGAAGGPRESVPGPDVQELEGALGALAGGDVAFDLGSAFAGSLNSFHVPWRNALACIDGERGAEGGSNSHVSQLLGDNQPIVADEGAACGAHAVLAVGGQGDVGVRGVAAVEGPLRLAVADDEDARCWCHGEDETSFALAGDGTGMKGGGRLLVPQFREMKRELSGERDRGRREGGERGFFIKWETKI